jgi:hypothetical protein
MTYSLYVYKVLKEVNPDTGIPNVTCSSYIYKVLKQVHPDTGISNKAVENSSYIYKVLKQVHHAIIFCHASYLSPQLCFFITPLL